MSSFVLVPGAWIGGWAWKKTIPLLKESGHSAYPLTLTGEGDRVHLASEDIGIETAVDDVLNFLRYEDLSGVTLVGHSFAGKVVAAVADRAPERISSILYLDAFRPSKIRSPQGGFDPSEWKVPPGSSTIPFSEAILNAIGNDVQGDDRAWMMSKATPWPVRHSTDSITLSAKFDSVKSSNILCTGGGDPVDEIIAGKWGKLEGPYKVIDSGHWPMITKPAELADDMIWLAGQVS